MRREHLFGREIFVRPEVGSQLKLIHKGGKVSMTEKNSGPEEGVKGVVEDVKGKAKEAVGTVSGP